MSQQAGINVCNHQDAASSTSPPEEKIACEAPSGDRGEVQSVGEISPGVVNPLDMNRDSPFSPENKNAYMGTPPHQQSLPDWTSEYTGNDKSMTVKRPQQDEDIEGQTVTPLHLLGDQADTVDCPFCRYRVETVVKRAASGQTKLLSVVCFFTTLVGVIAPFLCNWATHIDHYCSNCNRRITRRPHGSTDVEVFGTPEHLREASRFPAAPKRTNRPKKKASAEPSDPVNSADPGR